MKYSFWGIGIISLGMLGLVFLVMFESLTINNESEYYAIREAMEASMLESVDFACYRIDDDYCYGQANCVSDSYCGDHDIKIIEQKFVENFTRRFAASISGDATEYQIEFYDIIEMPAKATVVVKGKTKKYGVIFGAEDVDFTILNNLSGILELNRVGN